MKEEIRLFFVKIGPLVGFFVTIPVVSFAIWWLYPYKTLDVLIVDKTVPNSERQEHQAIIWQLQHYKYKTSDGNLYEDDWEYFGYFPDAAPDKRVQDFQQMSSQQIADKLKSVDLVYFADTYGVYDYPKGKDPEDYPGKLIYGGLNSGDLELLRQAKAQGKTIIAEYNSFATPTPKAIRSEFENELGVQWTGWIGRYFDELDTLKNQEIPSWIIDNYLEQHEGFWSLSGPGLLFVNEDGRIECLLRGRDFSNQAPYIMTRAFNDFGFSLPDRIAYPDWFDVVLVEREYQVLSFYDIDPTERGLEVLQKLGLPRFFPAVVFRQMEKGRIYYFAGDFSDMPKDLGSEKFAGLPLLWRSLYFAANFRNRQSFFWNYYSPLIAKIYKETSKKEYQPTP